MIPQSIRWRLPASYAAIALLATLALGAVMLASLRGYYAQREVEYLTSNAREIGQFLVNAQSRNKPSAALEELVHNFAFLSQA